MEKDEREGWCLAMELGATIIGRKPLSGVGVLDRLEPKPTLSASPYMIEWQRPKCLCCVFRGGWLLKRQDSLARRQQVESERERRQKAERVRVGVVPPHPRPGSGSSNWVDGGWWMGCLTKSKAVS